MLIDRGPCASQSRALPAPLGRRWCVETSPFSGFTRGMREEVWVCRQPVPVTAGRLSPRQEQGSAPPASGHWARSVQAYVYSAACFTHMQNRCVMMPAFVVELKLN